MSNSEIMQNKLRRIKLDSNVEFRNQCSKILQELGNRDNYSLLNGIENLVIHLLSMMPKETRETIYSKIDDHENLADIIDRIIGETEIESEMYLSTDNE